jgi:hypothetical protein
VRPKKYTHVVAHTLPHLVVDVLNRNESSTSNKKRSGSDDCWIMVFKIGPFTHWLDSVAFLNQWLCKTRGKTHRMERGLELFAAHREQFNLRLWTQTRKRDEALDYFWNHQPVAVLPTTAAAAAAVELVKEREQEQEEEKKEAAFSAWLQETRNLFTQPEQMTLGAICARIY